MVRLTMLVSKRTCFITVFVSQGIERINIGMYKWIKKLQTLKKSNSAIRVIEASTGD